MTTGCWGCRPRHLKSTRSTGAGRIVDAFARWRIVVYGPASVGAVGPDGGRRRCASSIPIVQDAIRVVLGGVPSAAILSTGTADERDPATRCRSDRKAASGHRRAPDPDRPAGRTEAETFNRMRREHRHQPPT